MFRRSISFINQKLLNLKYQHLISIKNLFSLRKRTISHIFFDEETSLKEIYLHNLVATWIDTLKPIKEKELKKIRKVIKKTGIKLNEIENHDLFLLEEQVFSLDRHIKIIEVDESLYKKETIGIKFTNAKLFFYEKGVLRLKAKGDFLVSNKRFFFMAEEKIKIKFTEIKSWVANKKGLELNLKSNIKYVIRIHDQITLKNTIENMLSSIT